MLPLILLALKPTTALAKSSYPCVKVNGKTANNRNKLNLDTDDNYIILKGHYSGCALKTNSKKIKLKYWGVSSSGKEWELTTKQPGKARINVVRSGRIIKSFIVVVRVPKIVGYEKGSYADFRLKGVGDSTGETKHKIKWIFTPVGNYGSNYKTIIEKNHDTLTFLTSPGIYKVKIKLLGKTYKLKKKVTVLECDGDFPIKSVKEMEKVLPNCIVGSLRSHGYSFSIVGKRTLDHFSKDLKSDHTISGIHDLDGRKVAVSNTSATVVLHEVGHFVSCSFQKVNGINLTQTTEWQGIYNREKSKFWQLNSIDQVGNTYAATSANEFFAECFQQYYLAPKTLRKNCPIAYKFIERTVKMDFPRIATVAW